MSRAEEILREGADALGVLLDGAQTRTLLAYLDAVLDENTRLNLTAVRDRDEAVVRHLLDSLSLVPLWHAVAGEEPPARLLDVGTGGGFPGAPLAVVWPTTRALLIDGTGKKVHAVERCLAAAGIGNAEPLQTRAVQLHSVHEHARGSFDLVVARAVGRAAKVLDEVARLPAPGGRVFLMKGQPGEDELAEARATARRRRLEEKPVRHTHVTGLARRAVLIYRKPRR